MLARSYLVLISDPWFLLEKDSLLGRSLAEDSRQVASWTKSLANKRFIEIDVLDIPRVLGWPAALLIMILMVRKLPHFAAIVLLIGMATGHVFFNSTLAVFVFSLTGLTFSFRKRSHLRW